MIDNFNYDTGPDDLDPETRRLLRETQTESDDSKERLRKLEEKVANLSLMTEALWTLLNRRTKLTDDDLIASIQEVAQSRKLREETRLTCIKCKMQNSINHKKCIYCGGELVGQPEKNPLNF